VIVSTAMTLVLRRAKADRLLRGVGKCILNRRSDSPVDLIEKCEMMCYKLLGCASHTLYTPLQSYNRCLKDVILASSAVCQMLLVSRPFAFCGYPVRFRRLFHHCALSGSGISGVIWYSGWTCRPHDGPDEVEWWFLG
jgi:hypothetical protein